MRGSIWTSIHTVVSTPVTLAATVVVARTLGPAGFGFLALLLVGFAIAFTATNFGVNLAAVQWCASAEASHDRALTMAVIARILRFRVLVQWPLLALGGLAFLRDSSWPLQVAYVLAVGAYLVFLGGSVALLAENRTALGARIGFVANLLTNVLSVAAVLATGSPEAVWVARVGGMAIGELLTLLFLDRDLRASVLRLHPTRPLPAGFVVFSRRLWVAGLLATIVYTRGEVIVLRGVGKTVGAGIFALAFGISYQITAPVDSLLGPLLPASAALVAAHPERRREALLRGLRFAALLSGFIFAALAPATYFAIPTIYSESFSGVALPFLFLAWISTCQSVSHPVVALVTGRRGGEVLVRAYLIAAMIDVGLALALIPWLGVPGAVVASVAGQVVPLVLLTLDEKRQLEISGRDIVGSIQAWVRAPVAAGVALVAGLLVGPALFPGADILAALVSGTIAFLAVLRFRLCPLTAGDRDAVLRSFPAPLVRPFACLMRLLPGDKGRPARDGPASAEVG